MFTDNVSVCFQYSDTNLFKIYVGVAFGVVIALVLIVLFWNVSTKHSRNAPRFEGSLRHRALRKKDRDVEQGDLQPLIDKNADKRNLPPEVPPVDF